MAECMPYFLAAYEQEVTTPLPSRDPPVAKALFLRDGSDFSSTAQKNASRSRWRIFLGTN